MTVTQRLMASGSWTVKLRPETPSSVRSECDFFGHVVITPARVDPRVVGDAGMMALSRYTGVVRKRGSDGFELSGPGLAFWLGDEDGKGDVLESAVTQTAASFSTWVAALRPSSLDAGTVTSPAGTLTHRFRWVSRRAALDYVCDYFGAEWRITPAGALDAGEDSDLFATTPEAVAVRRGGGGTEGSVRGLTVADLALDADVEDYTTRCVVLARGDGEDAIKTGSANISPATSYKDLNGNAVVLTRLVNSPNTRAGNENAVASAQLNRFTSTRKAVSLSTDTFDVAGIVEVGDYLYVYDPEQSLYDTANQIPYRGQVITPIVLRCLALTWPLQDGMGVYYRDGDGNFTDLSPWVEYETGAVSYEVGARARAAVTDPEAQAASVAGERFTAYGVSAAKTHTATTDASGYITVTHSLGFTPTAVFVQPQAPISGSPTFGQAIVDTIGGTTFRVRCLAVDGTVINATSVTFRWIATTGS